MNKESLKEYLGGRYQGWSSFLDNIIFPIFGQEDFEEGYEAELLDSLPERRQLAKATGICSIKQVGKIYVGVEPLEIFDVTVSDRVMMERNRVNIQRLIRAVMDQYSCAFMLFHYEDDTRWDWRFTYCRKSGNKAESTDSKRYTFLLGPGQSCRTATDNFMTLYDKRDSLEIKDIEDAFSVEALTKQFYRDLFEWYKWAVDENSNVTFPNYVATEDDDRDDLEKKIIRMITRIMFVWFIKQKDLVPNCIFDIDYLSTILRDFDPYSTTSGNYYNAILQNLFFGTLNRAIIDEDGNTRKFATASKRDIKTLYRYAELFSISEPEVIKLFSEVPFLNGGLFECLDKTRYIDGVEQCYNFDGFSRNDTRFPDGRYKHRAIVPNNLFFEPEKGLISILKRYNFTIEENSPEEQQVALDPELLGKVFENLLGAYNPETKETARNQSGSFYTPREIVNYMVDESLISYLGDNDLTRSLFRSDFKYDKSKTEAYSMIADKLKSVKILDPACGSGAFPMGLLNRMVDIFGRISPDENIYDLKLSIIENCIYGSDIQSIAAQITKLRFFISLICDCEKDATKPNFGIPTLPNLETKFVSANSLVAKKKKDLQGNLFENPEIEPTKNALYEIRHKHFSAKSPSAKHRLRKKDQELREKLANLLSDENNYPPEDAKQLAAWNPYDQNAVSPFFDPEWMFGVADGFDIVIGNPPYLRIQELRKSNNILADYLVLNYKSAIGSFDLYVTFVELGLQLVKSKGVMCYIMPVKWTNSSFGKGLRGLLCEKSFISSIINFGAYQVFNASTYTGIHFFKYSESISYLELDRDMKNNQELQSYLNSITNSDYVKIKLNTPEVWILTNKKVNSVLEKLNKLPLRLSDVFDKIFQGIATSKDDVYFLYDCHLTMDSEIEGYSKYLKRKVVIEQGLVKPLLKGEDVHRYEPLSSNRYVIFPYNLSDGRAQLFSEQQIANLFPKGYSYLKECEDELRGREKGRFDNDKWYIFGRGQGVNYGGIPKLLAPEISLGGNFMFDSNGQYYSTTKIYGYIKKDSCPYSYIFLLGLLNSSLFWFFIQRTGYVLRGGYYTFKTNYVSPFPIPSFETLDKILIDNVEKLVSELIDDNKQLSKEEIIDIMKCIDCIIYKIYSLSDEDIVTIGKCTNQ